ncbi:MAG: UvrB/UvrC motif-containing protein [bacterium]
MKCQSCGEREATIHYIEIVEGQKTSQWICDSCAEKEGIASSETPLLSHGGLEVFLGGMLTSAAAGPTPDLSQPEPICDTCGYTYRQLQKSGVLGCPACYDTFRRQLLPMLRRYHGDVHHLGKLARSHGPVTSLRKDIARLKLQLEQTILQEQYEEAAVLRDQIRDHEHQIHHLDSDPEAAAAKTEKDAGTSPATESDDAPLNGDSSGE